MEKLFVCWEGKVILRIGKFNTSEPLNWFSTSDHIFPSHDTHLRNIDVINRIDMLFLK